MIVIVVIFLASGSDDPRIVELRRAVGDPVPLAILGARDDTLTEFARGLIPDSA
ncbi:MAG: hypothetical protein HC794_05725 [Nitrospiraceae bacterium]|nr:hypothetical protein [Nitrospiraceae bacterium]